MKLPFDIRPGKKVIEVGNKAIGIFKIPCLLSLTPNEDILIQEKTKHHKDPNALIKGLVKKLEKTWESGFPLDDIFDSLTKGKGGDNTDCVEYVQEKLNNDPYTITESQKVIDKISSQNKEKKAAYVMAAMTLRLEEEEWDYQWGVDPLTHPDRRWNQELVDAFFLAMTQEEAGVSGKDPEVIESDHEDFSYRKGFEPKGKKPEITPEKETQKELIGAGSSG